MIEIMEMLPCKWHIHFQSINKRNLLSHIDNVKHCHEIIEICVHNNDVDRLLWRLMVWQQWRQKQAAFGQHWLVAFNHFFGSWNTEDNIAERTLRNEDGKLYYMYMYIKYNDVMRNQPFSDCLWVFLSYSQSNHGSWL